MKIFEGKTSEIATNKSRKSQFFVEKTPILPNKQRKNANFVKGLQPKLELPQRIEGKNVNFANESQENA